MTLQKLHALISMQSLIVVYQSVSNDHEKEKTNLDKKVIYRSLFFRARLEKKCWYIVYTRLSVLSTPKCKIAW